MFRFWYNNLAARLLLQALQATAMASVIFAVSAILRY
jgi:hypothetical protein